MAFMGMVIAFIFFLIIAGLFITMVVCCVVGLVTRKVKPVFGTVMLTISGVILTLFVVVAVVILIPKNKTIDTPDGEQTVKSNHVNKYLEAVHDCDYEKVDSLLTKHPALLYCVDINALDALQYYADNNDFDGVQLLLDHGARFDNGVTLSHRVTEYAISDYFSYDNKLDENAVKMLKIMIDNGADVNYTNAVYSENKSALFNVVYRATADSKIDETELEAAKLVVAAGVDKTKRDVFDQTAAEVYLEKCEGNSDELLKEFLSVITD